MTAPTEARIAALEKVAEAAYLLAFEFSTVDRWHQLYMALEELNESSRAIGDDFDDWIDEGVGTWTVIG